MTDIPARHETSRVWPTRHHPGIQPSDDVPPGLPASLLRTDRQVVGWARRHGARLLRGALALVYIWFGALKFQRGSSPAEDLAARTLQRLTFGAVDPEPGLRTLAGLEVAIGLGMLSPRLTRPTLALMAIQMAGACSPLVLYPGECFHRPWQPTLEGQYIIKNAVLVAAGIVLASTVSPAHSSPGRPSSPWRRRITPHDAG